MGHLDLELKRKTQAVFVHEVEADEVGIIELERSDFDPGADGRAGLLLIAPAQSGMFIKSPKFQTGKKTGFLSALEFDDFVRVPIEIEWEAEGMIKYQGDARPQARRHLVGR